MIWLIIAFLILAAAVIGFLKVDRYKGGILVGGIILAVVASLPALLYTNDEGEASVIKSWTGEVLGYTTTPGVHFKSPFADALSYDIRNQQVNFTGDGSAEDASGPQITVQDAEGVTANVDIAVRYSIVPDSVTDIYSEYGDQESFVVKFIDNDIRAAVRTIPSTYGTLDFLNSRAEIEQGINDYLTERWAEAGVQVEGVSLQEIRYSDEVKARFDEAQSARIEVEKAEANLEASKVNSQAQIADAEAKAEANRLLAQSLTPEVLQQNYYDTLRSVGENGNLVIVPEGADPLVTIPPKE